ncbi:MAG: MFS transporter [Gracilibacteraceae bacterium]|jgi:MFS family permease|nr:MFS transporter [Gracilibacteraceae bacterium]
MATSGSKSYYPWVVAVSALFWSGLVFGLMANTVGLYYAPVSTEMGWSITQTSFFMTIFPIVAGVFSPIAGKLYSSYPKTHHILAGVALVWCLAHIWSAFYTSVWQWNVYGFITGILGGLLMYIPIPLLINNWFTLQKGVALGLAACFVNIVPAVFNPIITNQIALHGWRSVRLTVAIAVAVVVIPLTLALVRKFPQDKGLQPWGGQTAAGATAGVPALSGVKAGAALASAPFWLAILMVSCLVSTASINQRIAGLAAAREFDPAVIGLAASCIMIGAVVGKFILGFIRDISKNAVVTGVVCGCFGLLGCFLFLTLGTSSVFMFFASILIYGFGYAGLTVVPPIVVESAFGGKNFAQIFANVSVATCVASSISSLVYAQIIDRSGGRYEGCFVFAIILYAVFTICVPLIIKLGQKLPRESAEPDPR